MQGCSLKCKGCVVPELWDKNGGTIIDVEELANKMLMNSDIEGITVSGGEPTEQAEAVAKLLSNFKKAGKNTWVYSGYTIEELVAENNEHIDLLLAYTDVLVDGRYDVNNISEKLLWRGSSNQREIHLSNVFNGRKVEITSSVQLELDKENNIAIMGVPPTDFLNKLKVKTKKLGIKINYKE